MCTSVQQTPARRTRIRTSSSRMVGSGTFLSTKPGAAEAFTSAFTREDLQRKRDSRNVVCDVDHETSHGRWKGGSERDTRASHGDARRNDVQRCCVRCEGLLYSRLSSRSRANEGTE